jgi:hypothetical protein
MCSSQKTHMHMCRAGSAVLNCSSAVRPTLHPVTDSACDVDRHNVVPSSMYVGLLNKVTFFLRLWSDTAAGAGQ